jgi:hypothetical protein
MAKVTIIFWNVVLKMPGVAQKKRARHVGVPAYVIRKIGDD